MRRRWRAHIFFMGFQPIESNLAPVVAQHDPFPKSLLTSASSPRAQNIRVHLSRQSPDLMFFVPAIYTLADGSQVDPFEHDSPKYKRYGSEIRAGIRKASKTPEFRWQERYLFRVSEPPIPNNSRAAVSREIPRDTSNIVTGPGGRNWR
jgi:hypothetical protein